MSRRARDGITSETLSMPSTADEAETAPLGVKLCCVVGVLVWLDHVGFLTDLVATGKPSWFLSFVALGTGYSCILYGLWTRRRWSWGWAMVWFTLVGALSVATLQYGRAIVAFVLLAYLKNVDHVFRELRRHQR